MNSLWRPQYRVLDKEDFGIFWCCGWGFFVCLFIFLILLICSYLLLLILECITLLSTLNTQPKVCRDFEQQQQWLFVWGFFCLFFFSNVIHNLSQAYCWIYNLLASITTVFVWVLLRTLAKLLAVFNYYSCARVDFLCGHVTEMASVIMSFFLFWVTRLA